MGAELTGTVCPRGQDDISEPATPTSTELAESVVEAHQAFWNLLKREGYEEW